MLLVIVPPTICTDCPRDSAGPAITSNPSKEGALKLPSSGEAFSENSTRKASPTATVSGELASKVTFSAPNALKATATRSAAPTIFAIKPFIDFTTCGPGRLVSGPQGF